MRLIDADALAENHPQIASRSMKFNLDLAPTIDAEPVVHARWMQDDTLKDLYFCSKCLTRDHRKPKHKFCRTAARAWTPTPRSGRGRSGNRWLI